VCCQHLAPINTALSAHKAQYCGIPDFAHEADKAAVYASSLTSDKQPKDVVVNRTSGRTVLVYHLESANLPILAKLA
jgi:hypothetical protein